MAVTTLKPYVALTQGRLLVALAFFFLMSDDILAQQRDTTRYQPSRRPTFQVRDRYGDPFSNTTTESPLFLKDPNKLKLDVEIDTALNYTIYEKIGDLNYRPTTSMTFEEFKHAAEREFLLGKLREYDWNVSETARALEMPRSNLYKKIERYGLNREPAA